MVREEIDGGVRLELSGVIDDSVDLGPYFEDLPEHVEVDLRGIDRINSIGVRNWVGLLSKVTASREVFIEAVSYPMVMQAICVHSFFGRATVVSCMAPYSCLGCGRTASVVVSRTEAASGMKDKPCSECKAMMSFDELDQYLSVFERGA